MTFDWDTIIVGAGAAGLMAAIHAAERGRRVLLLEKGKKPGVKILMSGGTRCNITHDCDARGIVAAFGPNGKFLHSALAGLGPRETVAFFEGEGVATKIEDTGKVFPISNRAVDVLEALLRRLARSGATLSLNEPAREILGNPSPQPPPRNGEGEKEKTPPSGGSQGGEKPPSLAGKGAGGLGGGFRVVTSSRTATCEKLLITTGGRSYPGCGTTGDGYAWARAFGHTILPQRPALVPVTVQPAWIGELRGITLPDVNLRVLGADGKQLDSRRGSLLFAHFGLTGPAPLDVSRAISGHPEPKTLTLEVDLLPGEREQQFDEWVRVETAANGKQLLAVVLSAKLPRRVCDQLVSLCDLPPTRTAAALAKPDRQKLVSAVKRLRLPVKGTLGFEKAEVTAGGVNLDEVDSRTMQSKKQPGLYLAGEVLDLDGWIGGYNFQSAWSTGWLAGQEL